MRSEENRYSDTDSISKMVHLKYFGRAVDVSRVKALGRSKFRFTVEKTNPDGLWVI